MKKLGKILLGAVMAVSMFALSSCALGLFGDGLSGNSYTLTESTEVAGYGMGYSVTLEFGKKNALVYSYEMYQLENSEKTGSNNYVFSGTYEADDNKLTFKVTSLDEAKSTYVEDGETKTVDYLENISAEDLAEALEVTSELFVIPSATYEINKDKNLEFTYTDEAGQSHTKIFTKVKKSK